MIAVDTETMGLLPQRDRLCLVQLCNSEGKVTVVLINKGQKRAPNLKTLMEAEKISKEDFDATKLLVISAVGTREYYKKLGYSLDGPYMSKQLR